MRSFLRGTILEPFSKTEKATSLAFRVVIRFMDIKRSPKSKLKKRIRTGIFSLIGLGAVGGITVGLTKLKPAAPTHDRSTAVIDTVKRGRMLREVRGNGTLVPQVIRWAVAPSEGRVEKILV